MAFNHKGVRRLILYSQMETIALIITIVVAAVGATWVLSTNLSSIRSAISSLVARVNQHDADIIDLKKRRDTKRR